jgi:LysM repeat protein
MKIASYFGIILMILAGCRGIQISDYPGVSKLTPYITQAENSATAEIPAVVTETVPVTAPTATPIIHVVALGETISSIALHYGMPMDAIIKANLNAKPNALIVGDELVIPASNNRQAVAVDQSILENIQISDPDCIRTGDGGLWCAVHIDNKGQEDLENIVATISFRDSDGNVLEERSAPTLMRYVAAGAAIPAVVFLEKVPEMYTDATASLFSALIAEASISPYLTVAVEEETRTLDRLETSVATNEMFNFNITVYSSAGSIARVVLYTEAYKPN